MQNISFIYIKNVCKSVIIIKKIKVHCFILQHAALVITCRCFLYYKLIRNGFLGYSLILFIFCFYSGLEEIVATTERRKPLHLLQRTGRKFPLRHDFICVSGIYKKKNRERIRQLNRAAILLQPLCDCMFSECCENE